MGNKYSKHTKLTEPNVREVVRFFVANRSTKHISEITGISRPSIVRIVSAIRERLADYAHALSPFMRQDVARSWRKENGFAWGYGKIHQTPKYYIALRQEQMQVFVCCIADHYHDLEKLSGHLQREGYEVICDLRFELLDPALSKDLAEPFLSFLEHATYKTKRYSVTDPYQRYLFAKEIEVRFNARHDDLYHTIP